MNHEMRELELQLERATSPRASPETPLDPETAALREGWLALAQMLQAAEQRGAALPEKPAPLPRKRPHLGSLAVVAALTACLSAGVILAWMLAGSRPSPRPSPRSVETARKDVSPSNDGRLPAPAAVAPSPTAPKTAPIELAWDDPLDAQIITTAQAVAAAKQEWPYLADAAASVRMGLEQVQNEMDDSPL